MSRRALVWWGLLILWCGLIFWGTGDPHFTGEHTQAVVAQAAPGVGEWLNVAVRKVTHVVLFAVLGLLAQRALTASFGAGAGAGRRAVALAGWAWLFTTLYAASDEFHQHFVPGRTASVWDVLLDSAAAAVVVLLIPGLFRFRN